MARPVLYVLAGVNGAGKSSVGGHLLSQAGLAWYNPDSFARALVDQANYSQHDANIAAWGEGIRRLDRAIAQAQSHAFETTLGGNTIVRKLISACATHDVIVWYCALSDAEQHISRVRFRVTQGGHDIPEDKIRARWQSSLINLIALLPHVHQVRAYDNSVQVGLREAIPDPRLVLHWEEKKCVFPASPEALRATPQWAKPLVEAALRER